MVKTIFDICSRRRLRKNLTSINASDLLRNRGTPRVGRPHRSPLDTSKAPLLQEIWRRVLPVPLLFPDEWLFHKTQEGKVHVWRIENSLTDIANVLSAPIYTSSIFLSNTINRLVVLFTCSTLQYHQCRPLMKLPSILQYRQCSLNIKGTRYHIKPSIKYPTVLLENRQYRQNRLPNC